jgi:hypothetical protein
MSKAQRLTLIGAILMAVGSLLPWGRVVSILGTLPVSGLRGDGSVTLVLAVIALIVALTREGKPGRRYSIGVALIALVGLLVAGSTLLNVIGLIIEGGSSSTISVGEGVVALLVGSVLAGIGGLTLVPGEAEPGTAFGWRNFLTGLLAIAMIIVLVAGAVLLIVGFYRAGAAAIAFVESSPPHVVLPAIGLPVGALLSAIGLWGVLRSRRRD